METLILFFKTVCLRPYVFVFLLAFLMSSTCWVGLKRTLAFLFTVWIVAFLSEYSSTRNGFPYGLYHYTESTRGEELFIANVPFMDSLSYSFLLFASLSMALFTVCPLSLKKNQIHILDSFRYRHSLRVLLLTALYMMMIDVVIDPVALQGEKWFLGKIYDYAYRGHYFGVPLSNAIGWGITGFVAFFIYQRIEKKWFVNIKDRGLKRFSGSTFLGVGLYYGVLVFNLGVTLWIGEKGLFIAGCFIFLLPTVLLISRMLDSKVRASSEDILEHENDFGIRL